MMGYSIFIYESRYYHIVNISILQSFQWMSRVLQAVDSIHQVGIFCLVLVNPNCLPKTPLGGIHLSEVRIISYEYNFIERKFQLSLRKFQSSAFIYCSLFV